MHGAGSPQTQRVMIARSVNLKEKQQAAKKLCGID
jgi:aromatic ring hydroxylase